MTGDPVANIRIMFEVFQKMGHAVYRWPEIRQKNNVRKDGQGCDLVFLTDSVWTDRVTFANRLSTLHEHNQMDAVSKSTAWEMDLRGKGGMMCERTECPENNPDKRPMLTNPKGGVKVGPKVVLKRCKAVRAQRCPIFPHTELFLLVTSACKCHTAHASVRQLTGQGTRRSVLLLQKLSKEANCARIFSTTSLVLLRPIFALA